MSSSNEINLAWADANSDESCAMVSVKVAAVATTVQHFLRSNAVDSTSVQNHQAENVDALANLATVTAADKAMVATLTDTIAQLSSELASAQAKLISSLLDNQRLIKRLSNKGGSWNTSGGVTYGKTSGGGASGPWDGPIIHYCHTHGKKCPHPISIMQQKRIPEAVAIKNTRRNDDIRRLIIANI